MSQAVIALGSNMGNRMENLNDAVRALIKVPGVKIVKASHIYETEPWGITHQESFLNAVLLIECDIAPHTLLGACLGIEAAMGRIRTIKNGPRIIDLDVLLYENYKNESRELTLPHPGILERSFVLAPLNDLFPSGRALGLFFAPQYREIGDKGILKLDRELIIPDTKQGEYTKSDTEIPEEEVQK